MTKKTLLTNFSALTALQVVHYLVPLIVLPYLVRVIGPEKFGIVSFAQVVAYYFALIPDMGTGLYAPREIALIKSDRDSLARFVTGILSIKGIALLLSLAAYALLIYAVPQFRAEIWVFVFSAGFIVGEGFIPVWFFQGIEKMVNITVGVFIIRILALVLILVFIRSPGDYIYVPLINSGALIFGTLLLWQLVFFREGVRIMGAGAGAMKKMVRESIPLFVSNTASNLNAGISIIVMGFLASDLVLGYYAAAERLVKVGMGLLTQVSTVFYPHISRLVNDSRETGIAAMKKGFVAGMLLSIPATVFVVSYAEVIVSVVLGAGFPGSVVPLRILGALFGVTGLATILGVQVLLPLGKRQGYMRPVITGFACQFVLALLLIPPFGETGAALAYVLGQTVVVFLVVRAVRKLSLGGVMRSAWAKLASLAAVLGAFSLASRAMGLDGLVSIGAFCLLYAALVVVLRIIDVRDWSIAA